MKRTPLLILGALALTTAMAHASVNVAAPVAYGASELGEPIAIAPWARAVLPSEMAKSRATDPAYDMARPSVLVESDYPAYEPTITPDQSVFLSIGSNDYQMPVTLYMYRQNRDTGERLYYNGVSGLQAEDTITDLFGSADPIPVWAPTLGRLEVFGSSSSAFGAGPALEAGKWMWVAEIRDTAGQRVIQRSVAMFNVVDAVVPVSANVSADTTWTANNLYILTQPVFIDSEAVLTIEPGTVVFGDTGNRGTLIVAQGAQLVADGTPLNPIVMTSQNQLGQRAASDWGGLIINGYAPINVPGGTSSGEGDTGEYGGGDNPDPNDSSGILRYVRIEWAGIEFSPSNELNGIAFQGVGNGTVVDHVQVHFNEDDGIEMFGGTVNFKHMLLTGIADDSMDWTEGWQGKGQFVAVVQFGADGDHGVEADNWENDHDASPRSSSAIYNATFIGSGDTGDKGDDGLKLRRGTGGDFHNWIVYGFRETGLDVDDPATFIQANNDGLVLDHSIINGNGDYTGQPNFKDDADAAENWQGSGPWFTETMTHNRDIDPMLAAPFYNLVPDISPLEGSPVLDMNYVASPPDDGFFEPVDYIGAVSPGHNWTLDAWTNWSKN